MHEREQEAAAYGPVRLTRLREAYGRDIELVSDGGGAEAYRLLAEFRLGKRAYAALQTPAMRKNDEIAFFRVEEAAAGELSLESVDDEDEWETASEGYDELLFEEGAAD